MKSIDLDPGLGHLRNRVSILLAAARQQLGPTEFASLLGRQCALDRMVSRKSPRGLPPSELAKLHHLLDVVFRDLEEGKFRGAQLNRALDLYERLARWNSSRDEDDRADSISARFSHAGQTA